SLLAHGIYIQSGSACPAYAATQVALEPGGDLLLEFLLENGMQLSCLSEPPMLAFLRFRIATDNYSADRAIKVAEALVRHGVDVGQLNSRGESIFNVLHEKDVASRSHADVLREALTKLANQR
ncbi:MAG: hypothetical protein Q8N81_01660, partial [bacterium]|nr:hypothetical protein [bacterium]